MSESTTTLEARCRLGILSAAILRNRNEQGKATSPFVVFQKSTYNRETEKYADESIALNAVEVSAAIRVLQQIEEKLLHLSGAQTDTREAQPA